MNNIARLQQELQNLISDLEKESSERAFSHIKALKETLQILAALDILISIDN